MIQSIKCISVYIGEKRRNVNGFRTLKKKNDIADKKTVWDVVREEIYETGFKTGGRRNFVLELLLDETICEGDILIPKELIQLAGGRNDRLPAKKNMSFTSDCTENVI